MHIMFYILDYFLTIDQAVKLLYKRKSFLPDGLPRDLYIVHIIVVPVKCEYQPYHSLPELHFIF